jgi:hypothetical protein
MALSLDPFSRFKNTQTVLFQGEEVHGKWVPPTVLTNGVSKGQARKIVVGANRAGRPDRISLDEYGTSKLDWFLIAFNNAREALNWPRAGDVISIPSKESISSDLP